jgi:hypothetical protein
MFARTRHQHRLLHVEPLERRELLAGNVSASVAGGTLFVRGNGEDNNIAIVQLGAGVYAVAGLDTTVNGDVDAFVTNRPVRNIIVDLGRGDDLLGISNDAAAVYDLALNEFDLDVETLTGIAAADLQAEIDLATADTVFDLPGSLTIRTGDGNDGVAIVGRIGGSLIASLGNGFNAFGLDGTTLANRASVGGVLSITGGAHGDEIVIYEANVGSFTAVTAGGEDLVHIADSDIRLNLIVNTGAGNDSVVAHSHGDDTDIGYSAIINTGSHSDYVAIEGDIGGSLTILTGDGADGVELDNTTVRLNLTINTGSGNDNADGGIDVGNPDFTGTAGVNLDNVDVGYFAFIYLGLGVDTLDVTGSSARRAFAYGQGGFDRVTVDQDTLDAIDFFFRSQFEDENLG